MKQTLQYSTGLHELFIVLEALFDEKTGCPWDKQQTTQDMCKYLIDEVYELVDAIHDDSKKDIIEETGDVFFLLGMLLKVYSKDASTILNDALLGVSAKMRNRHPHVFDTAEIPKTEEEYSIAWEKSKKEEKKERASQPFLASIPRSIHPFPKAIQIQKKLRKNGFEQKSIEKSFQQIQESKDPKSISLHLIQHLYALLAFAEISGIDIQSSLEEYNQRLLQLYSTEKEY